MTDKFWPGTLYLKSVYKSLPADPHLELHPDALRPCPDCGKEFDAYHWRMHRGVSYNEICPNTVPPGLWPTYIAGGLTRTMIDAYKEGESS